MLSAFFLRFGAGVDTNTAASEKTCSRLLNVQKRNQYLMNWKKFLRPTWKKLSIFLIIALSYTLMLFYFRTIQLQSLAGTLKGFRGNWDNSTIARLRASYQFINNADSQLNYLIIPFVLGLSYLANHTTSELILDLADALVLIYWYLVACTLNGISEIVAL